MNENVETTEVPSAEPVAPMADQGEPGTLPERTPRQVLPIAHALERYLAAIRGIGQTAQIALPHIAKWTIAEIEKTQKKIEKVIP